MQKVYRNILVLVAGFCALHFIFHGKAFLIVALTVLLLSAAHRKLAVLIDRVWLWIGETVGKLNAAILLFLVYYLILTPLAWLARLGKKDPLHLRKPRSSNFVFRAHRYRPEDLRNPW